jgi:hypothetical protein
VWYYFVNCQVSFKAKKKHSLTKNSLGFLFLFVDQYNHQSKSKFVLFIVSHLPCNRDQLLFIIYFKFIHPNLLIYIKKKITIHTLLRLKREDIRWVIVVLIFVFTLVIDGMGSSTAIWWEGIKSSNMMWVVLNQTAIKFSYMVSIFRTLAIGVYHIPLFLKFQDSDFLCVLCFDQNIFQYTCTRFFSLHVYDLITSASLSSGLCSKECLLTHPM